MNNVPDSIVIAALELWKKNSEATLEKTLKLREKEIVKRKAKVGKALEYESEDDIRELYGYGCITEKKCDELIDQFRMYHNNLEAVENEPTALSEYIRMLQLDIFSVSKEIASMKGEDI